MPWGQEAQPGRPPAWPRAQCGGPADARGIEWHVEDRGEEGVSTAGGDGGRLDQGLWGQGPASAQAKPPCLPVFDGARGGGSGLVHCSFRLVTGNTHRMATIAAVDLMLPVSGLKCGAEWRKCVN